MEHLLTASYKSFYLIFLYNSIELYAFYWEKEWIELKYVQQCCTHAWTWMLWICVYIVNAPQMVKIFPIIWQLKLIATTMRHQFPENLNIFKRSR